MKPANYLSAKQMMLWVPVLSALAWWFIVSPIVNREERQQPANPQSNLPASSTVNWAKYAPELEARLRASIVLKDCEGLQREFDIASSNSQATRSRTGASNSDLMDYLDDSMRTSGCYEW